MNTSQQKWIVQEYSESPIPASQIPAQLTTPNIFLGFSLDPAEFSEWELSLADDGDLLPDWVTWWMHTASDLANTGLQCVLVYIANERSLFRRASFTFAPLSTSALLSLLADSLHWGTPSQGGLFWSASHAVASAKTAYDGCILPAETHIYVLANTADHIRALL